MKTPGAELSREIARVRDEVMPAYVEIGASGTAALALMQKSIEDARKTFGTGDAVAMGRALVDLKGYHT